MRYRFLGALLLVVIVGCGGPSGPDAASATAPSPSTASESVDGPVRRISTGP